MNARELSIWLNSLDPNTPVVIGSGYFTGYDDVELELTYISEDNDPKYRVSRGAGEIPSIYQRDYSDNGYLALTLVPKIHEADSEAEEYLRWLNNGHQPVPNWRDG